MKTQPSRQVLLVLAYRWDKRCPYCDLLVEEKEISVDHILPKSKGGTNDISNLTLCHKRCNFAKGGMTLDKYKEVRTQNLAYLDEHNKRQKKLKKIKKPPRVGKRLHPQMDWDKVNYIRSLYDEIDTLNEIQG